MKLLLNVGAEKAGTTWLYQYFVSHPEFADIGKELNVIRRDDLDSIHTPLAATFQYDVNDYFDFFLRLGRVSGDFTHYEGSTQNIFRILKEGFESRGIEVVPLYIMREPISRAWSAYKMLSLIAMDPYVTGYDMAPAARWVIQKMISCKYKETVRALDSIFPDPIYWFYEDMFEQKNMDYLCDRLGICHHPADFSYVNKCRVDLPCPEGFKQEFGLTPKTIEAVGFVFDRFGDRVPWDKSIYPLCESSSP